MGKAKTEIKVDVGIKVDIDDTTFDTCMKLMGIRAEAEGIKGMIIRFNEEGSYYSLLPLCNEDAVDSAIRAAVNCKI